MSTITILPLIAIHGVTTHYCQSGRSRVQREDDAKTVNTPCSYVCVPAEPTGCVRVYFYQFVFHFILPTQNVIGNAVERETVFMLRLDTVGRYYFGVHVQLRRRERD